MSKAEGPGQPTEVLGHRDEPCSDSGYMPLYINYGLYRGSILLKGYDIFGSDLPVPHVTMSIYVLVSHSVEITSLLMSIVT